MTPYKCLKCGHIWNYKGRNEVATCTNCGNKRGKKIVENEEK